MTSTDTQLTPASTSAAEIEVGASYVLRRDLNRSITAEVRKLYTDDAGTEMVRYIHRWGGEFRYETFAPAEVFKANYEVGEYTYSPGAANVLTYDQRNQVKQLAEHEPKTILVDGEGSAWQIGRVRKVDPETLEHLGDVPVMTMVGLEDVFELVLDGDTEANAELNEMLDCGPFTVVPLPGAQGDDDQAEESYELISREQADEWAGRTLSDDELNMLAESIPLSSIPESINTIAFAISCDS